MSLFLRLDSFINRLRDDGFNVPVSAKLDAMAAVQVVDFQCQNQVRIALRANICRGPNEQKLFDVYFREFWLGEQPERQVEDDTATLQNDEDDGGDELQPVTEKGYLAAAGVARGEEELDETWADFDRDLDKVMARLKLLMKKNRSRRWQVSNRGEALSLKHTLSRYLRDGQEFLKLSHKRRKQQKLKLICLVDLSHSMTGHTEYLLRFVLAMHRAVPAARTIFFSSDAVDMSRIISRSSNNEVLAAIKAHFGYWSSGTNIGGALQLVNETVPCGELNKSTVLMVSDGFDQGEPEVLQQAIKALKQRSKSIIWINPLLHTEGYAPEARAMRLSLPFIDHFIAAFDGKSLLNAVNKIALA